MWLHLTVAASNVLLDKAKTNDDMGALEDFLLQSQRDLLPGGLGIRDGNNLLQRLTCHGISQGLLHVLNTIHVGVHRVLRVQLNFADVAPECLLLLVGPQFLGCRSVMVVLIAKLKVYRQTQGFHLSLDLTVGIISTYLRLVHNFYISGFLIHGT